MFDLPTTRTSFCFALALTLGAASCGTETVPEPAETSLQRELKGANVLITLIDAAAIDHIGVYGFDRETMPFISSMAA